jgi:protein involved in temperature-dependent protein secretion
MRSQNHTAIAEKAVRSVEGIHECYEQSISEIEDLDHRIGRIEVERATTGRAGLHRKEMSKLRSLRLSAVQDRDYYSGSLRKVQELMDWLELEDRLLVPERY